MTIETADFYAKTIGLELARCAGLGPRRLREVRACFAAFDEFVAVVRYNIVSCYLEAALLAIKSMDDANGNQEVTDYILKKGRAWFDAAAPIRYERYVTLQSCKIVRHSRRVRGSVKAN